jgi:hypothetical protein
MSSEPEPDKTSTKKESSNTKNNEPEEVEESTFSSIRKQYFTTELLTYYLFGVVFLYFILNNTVFLNCANNILPGTGRNILGIFLLFLFYVLFFTVLSSSAWDMYQFYIGDKGGKVFIILGFLVTCFLLFFSLGVMPNYFAKAGLFSRGLIRTWNPFNVTPIAENNILNIINTAFRGNDSTGLFWGGESYYSKFLFKFVSLPLVIANFFSQVNFLNVYLIPTLYGDSSVYTDETNYKSGEEWSSGVKFEEKVKDSTSSKLFGIVLWIIKWVLFFVSFGQIEKISKYFNPVDWELFKILGGNNPDIASFFNSGFKIGNTKFYSNWFNALLIITLYNFVFQSVLFPTVTPNKEEGYGIFQSQLGFNILALVISFLIIGYFIFACYKKQQFNKVVNISFAGYKASSCYGSEKYFDSESLNTLQQNLNNTATVFKYDGFMRVDKLKDIAKPSLNNVYAEHSSSTEELAKAQENHFQTIEKYATVMNDPSKGKENKQQVKENFNRSHQKLSNASNRLNKATQKLSNSLGQQVARQPAYNPNSLGQQVARQPAYNPNYLGQQVARQPAYNPNYLGQQVARQPAYNPNYLGQQVEQPSPTQYNTRPPPSAPHPSNFSLKTNLSKKPLKNLNKAYQKHSNAESLHRNMENLHAKTKNTQNKLATAIKGLSGTDRTVVQSAKDAANAAHQTAQIKLDNAKQMKNDTKQHLNKIRGQHGLS